MAVYHLSASIMSRASGRSAVAAAAYRHATTMHDQQQERTFRYRDEHRVSFAELIVPEDAPEWAKRIAEESRSDPKAASERLWNMVERQTRTYRTQLCDWDSVNRCKVPILDDAGKPVVRDCAQVAREIRVALPVELTRAQQQALLREFVKDQLAGRGMVADVVIHDYGKPLPKEAERLQGVPVVQGNAPIEGDHVRIVSGRAYRYQPHAHVMVTLRSLEERRFGKTVREWNAKETLREIRGQWAAYTNFHLRMQGHRVRIDHRSYADRGIEVTPTVHVGPAAYGMRDRGLAPERPGIVAAIKAENAQRIADVPERALKILTDKQSTFTQADLSRTVASLVKPEDFQPAMERLHASPRLVLLRGDMVEPGTGVVMDAARYSTRDMIDLEGRMVDRADAMSRTKLSRRGFSEWLQSVEGTVNRTARSFATERAIRAYEREKGFPLNEEQRAAVRHITKANRLSVVIGKAGTGKTTMLGAAVRTWQGGTATRIAEKIVEATRGTKAARDFRESGLRVIGTAVSNKAAHALRETGIAHTFNFTHLEYRFRDADTIRAYRDSGKASPEIARMMRETVDHQISRARGAKAQDALRFLRKHVGQGVGPLTDERVRNWEKKWIENKLRTLDLTSRDIVVVDEASMLGSRKLAALIDRADRGGAKVVLIHDHQQAQAIEAGGAARAITERVGAAELVEVQRQKIHWQREASRHFGEADTRSGLELYRDHGQVHFAGTRADARARLLSDWIKDRAEHPQQVSVFLAHTNSDVAALNRAARAHLRSAGELGPTEHEVAGGHYAAGDRILFKGTYTVGGEKTGIFNGTFGTIEEIDGRRMVVRLDDAAKDAKPVVVDLEKFQAFTHGYAATVHKEQGATVDRAYLLASEGLDQNLSYVGMSRHRWHAAVYADRETFRDFDALASGLGRSGTKDTTVDYARHRLLAPASGADQKIVDYRLAVRAVEETYQRAQRPTPEATADLDAATRRRNVLAYTIMSDPDLKAAAMAGRVDMAALSRHAQAHGPQPIEREASPMQQGTPTARQGQPANQVSSQVVAAPARPKPPEPDAAELVRRFRVFHERYVANLRDPQAPTGESDYLRVAMADLAGRIRRLPDGADQVKAAGLDRPYAEARRLRFQMYQLTRAMPRERLENPEAAYAASWQVYSDVLRQSGRAAAAGEREGMTRAAAQILQRATWRDAIRPGARVEGKESTATDIERAAARTIINGAKEMAQARTPGRGQGQDVEPSR